MHDVRSGGLRVSWLILLAGLLAVACGPAPPAPRAVAETAAPATDTAPAALAPNDYVGSARCLPCHAEVATEWQASSHATTVVPASIDDEEQLATLIPCSGMQATHVLGDRHHVRYLVQDEQVPWGEGRWLALPCGFDVHAKELTVHDRGTWKDKPWETGCAACHVTGLRADDGGFDELGVGCEACHGPGGRHATTAARADVFAFEGRSVADEVTTCAQCHLQEGQSRRTGRKHPDGFRPGQALFDDYQFDWTSLDAAVKDGQALDVHQKLVIRDVAQGQPSLRCTSCHSLHGLGHEKHRLLPRQEACFTCHASDMSLKEYSQSCNVCEF